MFGYVRYDMPNLFVKDLALYRALYCGLCKGIGMSCGQRARAALTYDVAFLSAVLHNIAGIDIKVEKQSCLEHAIRKRPIAVPDPLTEELGALNTLLVYYKIEDDIRDGGRGKGKRMIFKSGYRRAKKKYPALDAILAEYNREQAETEKESAFPDMAAEPSAVMMKKITDYLLKDKATEATGLFFYDLGKWVYLIDALDDYDKDKKRRQFNVFLQTYGCESREALMNEKGDEIRFLFDTLFYGMREQLARIQFHYNRDLIDNVVLRGIPAETERVMRGEPRKEVKEKF